LSRHVTDFRNVKRLYILRRSTFQIENFAAKPLI
jgi:hypothetical protein